MANDSSLTYIMLHTSIRKSCWIGKSYYTGCMKAKRTRKGCDSVRTNFKESLNALKYKKYIQVYAYEFVSVRKFEDQVLMIFLS